MSDADREADLFDGGVGIEELSNPRVDSPLVVGCDDMIEAVTFGWFKGS